MYAVSAGFLAALRYSHNAYGYVTAWRGGVQLSIDNGSVLPVADDGKFMPLVAGEVAVDGSTPGVRRTLSATFAPIPGLWNLLAPTGTELRAFTVLRYPHGATEVVPQGVFDIDVQSMGYAVNGDIKVTAPDRWVRVQRGRFLTPRASTKGATVRAQIATLLTQVLPAGVSVSDSATSTDTVPSQTWDRDRDKAIEDLAKAASVDVYFDRNGTPCIRDAPVINAANPVWTVDASETGVMVDASRQRDRQRTANIVVVNSTKNDNAANIATQYVWDNVSASPTYAGSGAGAGTTPPTASSAGPFGQRPTFYSSPLLSSATQMRKAGATILAKTAALNAQLSLQAISNPALDDGDTIKVQLPPERQDLARPVEFHIVDKLSVPLFPAKSTQSIDTRSTLADYEES